MYQDVGGGREAAEKVRRGRGQTPDAPRREQEALREAGLQTLMDKRVSTLERVGTGQGLPPRETLRDQGRPPRQRGRKVPWSSAGAWGGAGRRGAGWPGSGPALEA